METKDMETKDMEAKDKAPEYIPSYTVMPNGQVQMTMLLPPMNPSQYPAIISPEVFAQQIPPQMSQMSSQFPQFPHPFSQIPNGPVHYMPYPYPFNPQYYPQPAPKCGKPALAIASLVTFIVGLFTFFPHLASIILSFVMVKKGYLEGARKRVVLSFAILELLAWLACASMSWFYTKQCVYNYHYRGTNFYYAELSTCNEKTYWGWIFIVVWFAFALMFGIARVVIVFIYAKRPITTPLPTSSSSAYDLSPSVPLP